MMISSRITKWFWWNRKERLSALRKREKTYILGKKNTVRRGDTGESQLRGGEGLQTSRKVKIRRSRKGRNCERLVSVRGKGFQNGKG